MKAYYLVFLLIIAGCTPQKRINRIIEHHPEILALDSVMIKKEIIIPGRTIPLEIPAARLFNLQPRDTIKLKKDSVNLIITRNQDSVFLKVVLPDQNSNLDTTIYYNKVKHITDNKPLKWVKILPWIALLLALSIIFRNFFKKS